MRFISNYAQLFSSLKKISDNKCGMKVTVVYAARNTEFVKQLDIPEGCSVQAAIEQSNVLKQHPEISLEKNSVGIFNEVVLLTTTLKENDRVEIYRPLAMDPMEARRLRAKVKG